MWNVMRWRPRRLERRGTGAAPVAVPVTRSTPVERLLVAFNLAMAAFWATALDTSPVAPLVCAAHTVALTVPWLFGRAEPLSPPLAWLRRAYPLLWLLAFWTEIDALQRALQYATSNDALIRSLDSILFGTAIHAAWMPAWPSLWVSEPLHAAYFAYYLALALPIIALRLQRRAAAAQEAELRLLLTFTVCFLSYAVFPVDGPYRYEVMYDGRPADGFFYSIVHAVNGAYGSLGAAFPSSHAAGAVTVAYLGWLYFSRRTAVLMSLHAALVVVATVYTQYHYAIDAIAGVLVALTLQAVIAPLLLHISRTFDVAGRRAPRLLVSSIARRAVRAVAPS